jgi:hypothetical protein
MLDPPLTETVAEHAQSLHAHLIDNGLMHSFMDPIFDPTMTDEDGCLAEFDPGAAFDAVMDRKPYQAPLFAKFLRRQTTAKTCTSCLTPKYEIDYGGVENFKQICGDVFGGRWMWDILVYPVKEIQNCDHEFDVCKSCTAKHLASVLSRLGLAGCNKLACPQCGRLLSQREIRRLADPETLQKYRPLNH